MRKKISTIFLAAISCIAFGGVKPVWELSKDKLSPDLQTGKIERDGSKLILKDGAAFAVPAKAFPNQKNFTVEVVASLNKLVEHAEFTVMKKQDKEDNGFSFGMNYRAKPWWARHISSVVNNIFMYSHGLEGQRQPKTDHPYTFTVAVRNGLTTFYVDGRPVKKCFMELIPNNDPMWIGRNIDPNKKTMPVTISSVKVYGADYKYVSSKERKTKYPRGVVAGKDWALDVPKVENKDWKKILIYGDSISMGYKKYFIEAMRKKHVYVYHCCHFVNFRVPKKLLEEMSGRFKFDAIIFNNGLHSLHWTKDKVSDKEVYKRMKEMVECFKKGAPQAKIFYLLTTPFTAKRPAPGKPVESLGSKNGVVMRLNDITEKVMKAENVPVIDVYSSLCKQLKWASGDGYHWQAPAYKMIADDVANAIDKAIQK